MMQQISEQENLQDFAGVLSGFTYLIRGLKELYVCICDDWDGINNTGRRGYSVNGYSENIIMFHLTGDSGGYSIMPLDKAFSDICGGKIRRHIILFRCTLKTGGSVSQRLNSVTVSIPLTNSFGRGPITSAWL